MLDGLLGKGWERKKRDGIDLENGWGEGRWRAWVIPCQNLNTQRLNFKGVDGALGSTA